MRIIAGQHRGRPLLPPDDAAPTRPITDRVKETLFNRLTALGLFPPPPAPGEPEPADPDQRPGRVLDVFAGTGSLGLEALSRHAAHCTFVEQDRRVIQRLEANIAALGLESRSRVLAASALSPLWPAQLADGSLRVAFVDPPFAMMAEPDPRDRIMRLLGQLIPKLEPGGVAVLRTPADTAASPGAIPGAPQVPGVPGADGPVSATYGKMAVHLYQRPLPDDAG